MKVNLHFHTKEDKEDNGKKSIVSYDLFEGLDKAKECGFKILAVTCHNFVVTEKKYYDYAQKIGILLIPGIEKTIEKKHVLIINAEKSAENIKTFKDLQNYKKNYSECLIIAPHPFFIIGKSLGKKLIENINLFDAVEYSWFHFKKLNLNKKAEKIAQKFNLPLIATSDTHSLNNLPKSYCTLKINDISWKGVKDAILSKNFKNFSPPQPFFSFETWNWLPTIKKIQKIISKLFKI